MEGTSVNKPEAERVPPANPVAGGPSHSTEAERHPLPHEVKIVDAKERLTRVYHIYDRIEAGVASQEELDALASGELARFLSDAELRYYRACFEEDSYWDSDFKSQKDESAWQNAQLAEWQARIKALKEQNQILKQRFEGSRSGTR